MSMNLNKVMLAGNLTRDPQVRFLANERAVADFGLAMNQRWKDKQTGDLKEEATFVDVECWGKTAELVGQYLTKGRACYIEGHLKLDQWDDKESGKKRSKLKIVADSVQFLGGKGAGDGSDDAETGKHKAVAKTGAADDQGPPF
jgi:single-strand DNA-binding protein